MTDRLTPEREAEIQQRAEAATPGPWEEHAQYGENFYAYLGGPYLRGVGTLNFGEGDDAEADKALTVNAREDIRTLLAELSVVRAERDTAHAELEQLRTSRWDATKVVADLESRLHATHSELVAAHAQTTGPSLPSPAETAAADESPHIYLAAIRHQAGLAHDFTKAGRMAEALEHVEAVERLLAVYRRAVGAEKPADRRVAELERVLARAASPESCRWEGRVCVTHSWGSDVGTCPHGEAQQLLGGAV